MKARLIAVGERAPAWVAQGFAEDQKRLSHWLPLELVEVEPGVDADGQRRQQEACAQLVDHRITGVWLALAQALGGGDGKQCSRGAGDAQEAERQPLAVVGHAYRGTQDALQLRGIRAWRPQLPGRNRQAGIKGVKGQHRRHRRIAPDCGKPPW